VRKKIRAQQVSVKKNKSTAGKAQQGTQYGARRKIMAQHGKWPENRIRHSRVSGRRKAGRAQQEWAEK